MNSYVLMCIYKYERTFKLSEHFKTLPEKKSKKVHRGEAALRKHLREHEQKAALSSERNKVEISLE